MTKPADSKGYDRRTFLRGLAGAGAATTALALAGGAVGDAGEPESAQSEAQPEREGYRLTPHIRTYYDKARF
ncbi:MAG: hypothetical protein PVG98_06185 [Chromatiales bacterium]